MNFHNTYAKIDLDAIAANIEAVSQKSNAAVMAVVKADAYGHGAVPIARFLEGTCAFFGVSSMAEALELRRAGIEKPILILGHTLASAFPDAIREKVRLTISCYEDALALSQTAESMGITAKIHIAVDTGMGRIGFQPTEESADICRRIAALPYIETEGLFSHFAGADCADLHSAQLQAARFDKFDAMLKNRGVSIAIRHLDNSAGLMNFPCRYEMVRSGIVTYGLYPSNEVDPMLLPIHPALEWVSRISFLKELPAGSPISYGGTYVTKAPTKVATIPVGYADGYSRSLSNCFHVLIHGQKAPILGRVCMDQMMVDVTHIPNVTCGDSVTLIGHNKTASISVEDIADAAGQLHYEFLCGISRRVPRIYRQNGKETEIVHYLLD